MLRPRALAGCGRRRALGLELLGTLLLAAALGATPARGGDGDDPGPGDWAAGDAYKALGEHASAHGVHGYAKEKWADEGQTTTDAWLWIVRREGRPELAYEVDAKVGEGGSTALTVFAVESAATETPDAAPVERVHVASGTAATPDEREGAVRALVGDADAAAADWERATAIPSVEGKDETDTERRRWRSIARSLEGAHEAHPKHLGILRDLLVAYARLFFLEGESSTASTLALLLPSTLDAWWAAADGDLTPEDLTLYRHTEAALRLRAGPHALAWQSTQEDGEDAELARVKTVLEGLGYESFDTLDPVDVAGGLLPCRVEGYRAVGAPKVPGAFFERLAFVVSPAEEGASPFATSYVLTGRLDPGGSDAVRWALYGVVGTTRRLLRLYGTKEPETDAVRAFVLGEVKRSLTTETPK